MARLLVRRLFTGLLTLLLVTVLVFTLIHFAPGSPLDTEETVTGFTRMDPETRAQLERLYHLDQPLHRQYFLWLGDVLRGDLGQSIHDRRPVRDKILRRIGVSLTLNTVSLIVMVLIAVPLGAAAALHPGSRLDRFSAGSTYMLYAMPIFWSALLLQMLFAVRLDWLPLAGLSSEGAAAWSPPARLLDRVAHLILPVVCLSYGGLAYLSRFVRAALLESSASENALAARARGFSSVAVVYRHGFRLAAAPLLTLAGFVLPGLVGGSVIVETIFSIPGLGRLFFEAAFQRDIPVIMGLTLLSGTATLIGILFADFTLHLVDPRVRRV